MFLKEFLYFFTKNSWEKVDVNYKKLHKMQQLTYQRYDH